MQNALGLAAIGVGLLSGVSGQSPPESALRQLYDQHRWFDLRDAIAGRTVPPLYSGAVAAAFNRMPDAEIDLRRAIHEARTIDGANAAREQLASLDIRQSRSADMVRVLDDMLTATPDRPDVRNMRDGFGLFRRIPNQTAGVGRRTPFTCAVRPDGISLPAQINGKRVEWLFDSGFSHSVVSEADARTLGIAVAGTGMTTGDFSATTQAHAAVADSVTIGDSELRNVPMIVFPDSHPMWGERPPGKRGIIALPVALALGGIRWTKGGTCQLGSSSRSTSLAAANLAFDADSPPVTRVMVEDRLLEVSVDTGAQGGTQLWQRFAADFPQLIARGTKRTTEVRQIGGVRERETVVIPELRLRIAGLDTIIPQARVLSQDAGDGIHYGNIGMDLFSQASEVTFDFRAMSLQFRTPTP